MKTTPCDRQFERATQHLHRGVRQRHDVILLGLAFRRPGTSPDLARRRKPGERMIDDEEANTAENSATLRDCGGTARLRNVPFDHSVTPRACSAP